MKESMEGLGKGAGQALTGPDWSRGEEVPVWTPEDGAPGREDRRCECPEVDLLGALKE